MNQYPICEVDKSMVNQVTFSNEDVLKDQPSKVSRLRNLQRALKLGHLHKQHVKIEFEDAQGNHHKTRATIWALTQKHVVLKAAVLLPVSSLPWEYTYLQQI